MKKAEFARRIGIPKTHIARLFSLRHHSRLDQLEAAFAALDKRLHIEARTQPEALSRHNLVRSAVAQ